MFPEGAMELTVHLVDARNTARRVFGETYERLVEPRRELLRHVAAEAGKPAITIVAEAADSLAGANFDGTEILLLIAAAVDLTEGAEPEGNERSPS